MAIDPVREAAAREPPTPERERVWARLLLEHGREVPEVLARRDAWINGGADRQDAAIAWVVGRLSPVFEYVATAVHRCGSAAHRLATLRHARSGVELQLLPGGSFKLGGERLLYVPPFLCGRFPVTREEWHRVAGREGSVDRPRLPIDRVSREAVKAWLRTAGDGLRLPSEAEWEYACRGGTDTLFYWGDRTDPAYCWQRAPGSEPLHEVDALVDKGNAFGLVDVLGNAREWCEDVWNETFDGGPFDHAPVTSGVKAKGFVLRGGGAASFPVATTCAYREPSGVWGGGAGAWGGAVPDEFAGIGLRVVASLPFLPARTASGRLEPVAPGDAGDPPSPPGLLDRLRGLLGGPPPG